MEIYIYGRKRDEKNLQAMVGGGAVPGVHVGHGPGGSGRGGRGILPLCSARGVGGGAAQQRAAHGPGAHPVGGLQQKGKAQPQCPVRKRGAFHQRRGNVSLYHDRFRGPEPAGGRHVHIHGGPVV